MKKSITLVRIGFLLSIFLISTLISAQKKEGFIPPSIDDEDIPVAKTELPVPQDGQDYVVQYFRGTTDGVESRIAIKKLGYIIRPAMVQVISEDGRELAIELVKKNWDDVVRSGKTIDGKFKESFKTAIEFGIKISAKEMGIPFIVAVSAGVELFPASNLFVDAGTMRSASGTEDSAIENEGAMTEENSGTSNNVVLIIIGVALVGILALLAFFIFKKKGKGTASILLLLFAFWPAQAGMVHTMSKGAVGNLGGLAGGIANALGKHYGSGGFENDDPLGEGDPAHAPEPDPRGQPSLPSSCYNIARISQSGGYPGGGTGNNGSGGKNAGGSSAGSSAGGDMMTTGGDGEVGNIAGTVAGGYTMTTSDAGGDVGANTGAMAGAITDNGAPDNADDALNQALENARIEYENLKKEISEAFGEGLRLQAEAHRDLLTQANKEYDRAVEAAAGNAEELARLTIKFNNRNAELATLNANKIAEITTRNSSLVAANDAYYGQRVNDIMIEYAESLQEELSRTDEGKDPNRDDDKNNRNASEKENDGGGKSAGSPTGPDNPSGGGEGDGDAEEGCACLAEAYANLQDNRHSLEKLLKIGQHTKKVTDYGISFGDNFSGVHGVSGLVWQKKRLEILKSIKSFDKTYDQKYNELIERLYNTLIEIDRCEKLLDYDNWYSHSGFIYYEFMKVRYASYK